MEHILITFSKCNAFSHICNPATTSAQSRDVFSFRKIEDFYTLIFWFFYSSNVCLSGLDFQDHMYGYEDLTDDDDDDEYGSQNNKYCGFAQNFLDKGIFKQLPAITHYKTVKCITPEVSAVLIITCIPCI